MPRPPASTQPVMSFRGREACRGAGWEEGGMWGGREQRGKGVEGRGGGGGGAPPPAHPPAQPPADAIFLLPARAAQPAPERAGRTRDQAPRRSARSAGGGGAPAPHRSRPP